jgi:hypothetical protein
VLGRQALVHRIHDREWFPDVWDLSGGHVEGRESPAEALAGGAGIGFAAPNSTFGYARPEDGAYIAYRVDGE